MAERDPEDRISDESRYGPPRSEGSAMAWAVNIPVAMIYRAFLWLGKRKKAKRKRKRK